jgi:sarcosine oxidase subunit beta
VTAPVSDTLVIGGGLHGLSAALHLARAGRRVTVVERAWTGRHASGASAAGVRTLNRDPAEIAISLESMDMWHRIEAIVGNDCGFHSHGQVNVAEHPAQVAVLEKRLAAMREAGYSHEELVDRAELLRLIPTISPHCTATRIGHWPPSVALARPPVSPSSKAPASSRSNEAAPTGRCGRRRATSWCR